MADSRPNVILMITDQQRYDTIGGLGFDYVDTPHLDRLIAEGIAFTHSYVTAASCAPARASLFKGYYPHTTGILKNADRWRHSWVERFQRAGYHCVNIGKMHTFPYQTELGFHERYVVENKDRYLEGRYFFDEWDRALRFRGLVKQQRELYRRRPDYRERLGAFEWELPEETHSDFFVGDLACWWIDQYPKTEPLFLQIGFPGPHPPYDPIPRYADHYKNRNLPLLEVTPDELQRQPPALKELRAHNTRIDHDSIVHLLEPTVEQRRRQRAYYLANVTMIDEKIGQIMDHLRRRGYLDNAIVVFTSDHGDCLTDHGHSQKWTMYEQITRVPLIFWSPMRWGGGRHVDGLCQQMDLAPSLLRAARIEVPPTWETHDLEPALEGKPWTGRRYVYAEQSQDDILTHCRYMTMVRDERWKLVHFLDEPHGQLFDLQNDSDEVRDLWSEPSAGDVKQRLLDELREWRIRSQYHTAGWSAEWR